MQNWKQNVKNHKKWCDILSPETFGSEKIGSTIIKDDEDLIGNTVQTTLDELSDTNPKRNGRVIFEVTTVNGDESYTELLEYQMRAADRINATDNGSVVISLDEMETRDGYVLEGNILIRRPHRWDTDSLLLVIQKTMEESEMADVLSSLLNASFTSRVESKMNPEVEFESLIVTTRPHGPEPEPAINPKDTLTSSPP